MGVSTGKQNHYAAIAYTATFLGLLLILFLFAMFFTSSQSLQKINKAPQLQATSQAQ